MGILGNWNDGGWLEASRDFALAERVVVDFTENCCSAQNFSVDGEILSGPAAFLIFSFVKRFFTSHGWTVNGGGGRPESESGGTAW